MKPVLLLCLLAACGVTRPLNAPADPPPGEEKAIAIVLQEWATRLPGGDVLLAAEIPPVLWFEGPCLDYGDELDVDLECPGGMFIRQPTPKSLFVGVEIHLVTRAFVHETALAHELLHWAQWIASGVTDNDHAAPEWKELVTVNDMLSGAGL